MKLVQLLVLVQGALRGPAEELQAARAQLAQDEQTQQRLLAQKSKAEKEAADAGLLVKDVELKLADQAAQLTAAQQEAAKLHHDLAEARADTGRLADAKGTAELRAERSSRTLSSSRKAAKSVALLLAHAKSVQAGLVDLAQHLDSSVGNSTQEAARLRSSEVRAREQAHGLESSLGGVQTGLKSAFHTTAALQEVMDDAQEKAEARVQTLEKRNALLSNRLELTLKAQASEKAALKSAEHEVSTENVTLSKETAREQEEHRLLADAGHKEHKDLETAAAATQHAVKELLLVRQEKEKLVHENDEAAAKIRHLEEELRVQQAQKDGKKVTTSISRAKGHSRHA